MEMYMLWNVFANKTVKRNEFVFFLLSFCVTLAFSVNVINYFSLNRCHPKKGFVNKNSYWLNKFAY